MEWVETTGRTLEEAKDAALDQLGVDEADAEFQVLDEPRPGLFGRMRGEARVRARVRPTTPRPKDDRRDRRRKGRARAGEGRPDDQQQDDQQQDDQQGPQQRDEQDHDEEEQDDRAAPAARKPRRSPRGQAGNEPRAAVPEASGTAAGSPAPQRDDDEDERAADVSTQMDGQELSLEEQGEIARRFLDGLLDAFELDGTIAVTTTEDEAIEVRIDGSDLGLLVGPRGTTLNALQELARTAVQRRTEARTARLHVDVAGYRERRREALERFARQQAEEVLASGEVRVLEPMAPADRKVIHDTINGIDGVATTSEGEEPRRRVVISPA